VRLRIITKRITIFKDVNNC